MYDKRAAERQRKWRAGEKAEDETRGNSVIDPVKYKKDMCAQVWLDSRYVATLSEWLDMNRKTRHLSSVIQDSLSILVEHLISTGEIEMVENTVSARGLLEWKYGVKLNQGKRGVKNVQHNQTLTERRRLLKGSVDPDIEPEGINSRISGELDVRNRNTDGKISNDRMEKVTGHTREELNEIARQVDEKNKVENKKERGVDNSPIWDPENNERQRNMFKEGNRTMKEIEEEDKRLSNMDMSAPKGSGVEIDN